MFTFENAEKSFRGTAQRSKKKFSLALAVANGQYCGVGQSGSQSFEGVKLGIFPNASMHWMGNSL